MEYLVNGTRDNGSILVLLPDQTDISGNSTLVNDSLAGNEAAIQDVYGVRFGPYTALSITCFFFNVISFSAMLNMNGRRSVHHVLILNLAICDMSGSLLLWMYYNSPKIFPRFKVTRLEHCMFIVVVLVAPFILSLSISALSLLVLALNQCFAICCPLLSATKVTRGRAVFMVLNIWILAVAAALLPAILVLFLTRFDHCATYAVDMATKSVEICTCVLAALIVVIVALYARIYREVVACRKRMPQLLRRSSGRNVPRSPGTKTDAHAENNYKAFITTFLLSSTMVLFWLPYMVFHFITLRLDPENISPRIIQIKFYLIDFLPMLNFLTDPIIYGIRMREIRQGYRSLFATLLPCCVRRKNSRPVSRASVKFTSLETTTTL